VVAATLLVGCGSDDAGSDGGGSAGTELPTPGDVTSDPVDPDTTDGRRVSRQ
jgi:hypothetical protein